MARTTSKWMTRRLLVVLAVVALAATACSGGDADTTTSATTGTTETTGTTGGGSSLGGTGQGAGVGVPALAVALQQFDQCDALLGWLHAEAVDRVGPYGFDSGPYPWIARSGTDDVAFEAPATTFTAAADGADFAASEEAGGGFSTTNVQEAGVDEPDIVKTDGQWLFILSENKLSVVAASSRTPTVVDTLVFEDVYPQNMLLNGDRLYVLGNHYLEDVVPMERLGIPASAQDLFVIAEVIVGDDGLLSEAGRLEISGGYVTARKVGQGARIVLRHDASRSLPFVFPGGQHAEETALEANRQAVLNSTIEDWFPWYRLVTADGNESGGMLPSCDRVTAPQEFSGMSTVSVLTLDMSAPLTAGDTMTLFGAADTIYASTSSLYAATYTYPPVVLFGEEGVVSEGDPDPDFTSAIHQFDISDLAGATYVASGAVPGHLLNQFAMSEYEGHVRVATTEGSPWWCCEGPESVSSVFVLRAQDGELVTVGSVGDLGLGEQIFGVRFVGDVGYVVTFRQTDPLYVIDLRDPAAPAVTGELKITGYSSYLHPISDDFVLGIGQEATLEGRTIGTKVSLFDVSDPTNPLEVDRWVLEQSSSPVEWDHKAFLYWEPQNLAVVPVDSWRGEQFGAVALAVGDGSLAERARIALGPVAQTGPPPGCEIVDTGDLGLSEDSELFWILEEGASFLRCDEGSARTLPGHYCESLENFGFPAEDLSAFGVPQDVVDDLVGGDASFDVCWPEGGFDRQVRRSVVVGDVLWTIGYRTVQSNDLATLQPLGTVGL